MMYPYSRDPPMTVRDDSTLHHVVINFTQRTIELHGDDGEYKTVTCDWTDRGCQEFENLVKYCQDKLPPEMRTYQL